MAVGQVRTHCLRGATRAQAHTKTTDKRNPRCNAGARARGAYAGARAAHRHDAHVKCSVCDMSATRERAVAGMKPQQRAPDLLRLAFPPFRYPIKSLSHARQCRRAGARAPPAGCCLRSCRTRCCCTSLSACLWTAGCAARK